MEIIYIAIFIVEIRAQSEDTLPPGSPALADFDDASRPTRGTGVTKDRVHESIVHRDVHESIVHRDNGKYSIQFLFRANHTSNYWSWSQNSCERRRGDDH